MPNLSILLRPIVWICMALPFMYLMGMPNDAYGEHQTGDTGSGRNMPFRPVFEEGVMSVQFVGGALWSPFLMKTDRPDIAYSQTNLRIGFMLSKPEASKYFFKGNSEGIIEITYSDVFNGSGNFLYGVACLYRYNIVYPKSRIFPFIQAGAGVIYNDIYKDRSQSVVGQSIEFTLRGSIGTRFSKQRLEPIIENLEEKEYNVSLARRLMRKARV